MSLLGEKTHKWNIEEEFIKPLSSIFKLPEVKILFSSEAVSILCEQSIVYPQKTPECKPFVIRPDRIVLFKDKVVIADFKSEKPLKESGNIMNKYKNQIQEYVQIVQEVFERPSEGYLLFIKQNTIQNVC